MKKKILALFAIVAVFGLAIAAYAYTQTTGTDKVKMSCCSKSDSCPMKAGGHDHKDEHAKSCPMETKSDGQAKADGHACCSCCGDSCPMKKDAQAGASAVAASENAENCCGDCDCCSGKHEKPA